MQYKFHWAAIALLSAFIQGCPSGSTPLGGVAAVGAPMSDATVVLVDANGTSFSVKSNAEGAYSFDDVSSMTAPFLLKATGVVGGDEETLYSALDEKPSPGGNAVLNATPMTNSVLVQASGGDPAALFANPKALDVNEMKAAKAKILVVLAEQMKEQGIDPNSFDPFKTPFKANSSGIDKMLDLVQIKADTTGQISLTDKTSGAITTFTKSDVDVAAKKMPPPPAGMKEMDFSQVKNLIAGLNAAMAVSTPSVDAVKEFIHPQFLSNGKTFDSFSTMIASESGTKLTGFKFGACDVVTLVCDGMVALVQKNGALKQESMPVIYDKTKASWKFYGNQRKLGVDLTPNVLIDVQVVYDQTTQQYTATPTVVQGFELDIENPAVNGSATIASAELWLGIKATGGTDFTYTKLTTFEKSDKGCYQLVLPTSLRSKTDQCDHSLSNEELVTLSKETKENLKAAYAEGRMLFKLSVTPVTGTKFDIPPFRPKFIELAKDDANFTKMLTTNFISSELGTTSVTMPKGVDLEWVGFYLYDGKGNTVEGLYVQSEDFKTLGDQITSEEICTLAKKYDQTSKCSSKDIITSIFWRFRDPLGSDLRIIYGYHF